MNFRMTKIAGAAAAALLATTLAAAAQGQTDTRGNAMGSQNVGNGMERGTMAPAPGMTTGAAGRMNGANHPTPSSTQGDVGPDGNNNGTRTPPAR